MIRIRQTKIERQKKYELVHGTMAVSRTFLFLSFPPCFFLSHLITNVHGIRKWQTVWTNRVKCTETKKHWNRNWDTREWVRKWPDAHQANVQRNEIKIVVISSRGNTLRAFIKATSFRLCFLCTTILSLARSCVCPFTGAVATVFWTWLKVEFIKFVHRYLFCALVFSPAREFSI